MAANKYLALITGFAKEVFATVVSAGVANANQIVALDSTGHLDTSVMPVGIGPDVVSVPSSENLTAGQFVNLFNNAGATNARKADATTNAKQAHGFVLANVTSPAAATVYLLGSINTGVTGLTPGTEYFLDTTPGGVTTTPPSTSGNLVQRIGIAITATEIPFENITTIQVG